MYLAFQRSDGSWSFRWEMPDQSIVLYCAQAFPTRADCVAAISLIRGQLHSGARDLQ